MLPHDTDLDVGGAASPKLSPDGKWIAFSDVRTDSAEEMVLARLRFAHGKYTVDDPRVLNPPGPTSLTDPNPLAWSNSASLFELKTFADGGRDITYVQVGGSQSGNPNLWKLDLRTGKRTRLTSYPEWEEDMAISPDGRSMCVGIDSQTRHYVDWAALLPFRGFFDASWIAGLAAYDVSSAKLRSCAPFSSALLPAGGDDNGRLVGQIVDPYNGGNIRDSGNYEGWPSWSHDSTAIALSTQSFKTLAGAPYLGNVVRVFVTSIQHGAGPNERGVDRRPIRGAMVKIGAKTATTSARGVALIHDATGTRVRVGAGDTFTPTEIRIR